MLSYVCWMCNLPNIIEAMSTPHVSTDFEAFATQPVPYIIKKNKEVDRIASPYSSAPLIPMLVFKKGARTTQQDLGLERELQVKP